MRTIASYVLILLIESRVFAQDTPTVLNQNIKTAHFEAMDYPITARMGHEEGAVIVRVQLDSKGNVTSASAVSGTKYLIPSSVENAKKWKFQPSQERVAIIVYIFRFEGACAQPCKTNFTYLPPNLALITVGKPFVDHAAQP